MRVNHGADTGDESRPEFGVEDASVNCPPPQILSCFKIALQALRCGKRLTNPMTDTDWLLSENTSSTSTKSPLEVEIQHWRGHGQKYNSECIKTRHFKWKIHFFWGGGLPQTLPLVGRGTSSHTPSLAQRPIKHSQSASASPRIRARFTPLVINTPTQGWTYCFQLGCAMLLLGPRTPLPADLSIPGGTKKVILLLIILHCTRGITFLAHPVCTIAGF